MSFLAAVMWELLAIAISALVLLIITIILEKYTWVWYTVLWVWGALSVLAFTLYVPLLYLNTRVGVNDDVIVYQKGVIFPSTQIMYKKRIAYITLYNNPLTALLKVSSLSVSSSGGNMTILFLNSQTAKELANSLMG